MAVEAYAALVSLMNVLIRIQYHCPVSFDQLQIQSLFDKVNSLVNFLEAYSQIVPNDLAEKMVVAAFAAEDTIESYIVDRLTGKSDEGYAVLCYDLEIAHHQEMDPILQEAMEIKDNSGSNGQLPRSVVPVGLEVPSNETIKMEGFDEQVNHLIGHLTSRQSSRQILPIVGMGGIGKTTLAKSVCKYPGLNNHFDIIAWVAVSQVFTAATIIRPLLRDIIGEKVDDVEDEGLEDTLYKRLFRRRYLIILDDIWDSTAWDAIRRFLPDNNNRSRILLTTRLLDVARSVSSCNAYVMKLLDDDKSWDLLSKKVFGQEVCPLQFEECGKRIAKNCKGLPLALVVIGGLLKMSETTLEYWEDVARNISSIISGEDNERCLEILSLSYHQLPIHLKPCFLYMATCREDHKIKVSEVIKLWAANGFLKPDADKVPEEIARKYLNDLIDRNLISVIHMKPLGNIWIVAMHDLVRDLCIREAQKERFLHVNGDSAETIENQRRLAVLDGREFSLLGKGSARSFICVNTSFLRNDVSCSRLIRVFFVPSEKKVTEHIVQPMNLRFLRCHANRFPLWLLSSSISLLWNLETLIVDDGDEEEGTVLPCDIWKLRHIKHLCFSRLAAIILPDPPSSEFVLEKLETLHEVQDLSDKALNNIPNIKHLGIYNLRVGGNRVPIPNMVQCHKLEILHISANTINLKSQMFPDSIRELYLRHSKIPWGSMALIGSLPNLEMLVTSYSFKGKEWTTSEGDFQSLKYLSIWDCDLVRWITDDCSHFPSLEHLKLWSMEKLEEIPQVFGESMTLQSIMLWGCRDSVVTSAKGIVEEQQSNGGNDEFTLTINNKLYSRPQDEVKNQPISAHHHHEDRKYIRLSQTRLVMLWLFRTRKHLRPTRWRRRRGNWCFRCRGLKTRGLGSVDQLAFLVESGQNPELGIYPERGTAMQG